MLLKTSGCCLSTTSNKTSTAMTLKSTYASPLAGGKRQYTLMGNSAYSMNKKMNSFQPDKPVIINMDFSDKWLGADCGSTKPTVMLK